MFLLDAKRFQKGHHMKRAVAFALAFATLGLTACSGSTTVVENSEPKVIQEVCRMGRRPGSIYNTQFKALLFDDGSTEFLSSWEECE